MTDEEREAIWDSLRPCRACGRDPIDSHHYGRRGHVSFDCEHGRAGDHDGDGVPVVRNAPYFWTGYAPLAEAVADWNARFGCPTTEERQGVLA